MHNKKRVKLWQSKEDIIGALVTSVTGIEPKIQFCLGPHTALGRLCLTVPTERISPQMYSLIWYFLIFPFTRLATILRPICRVLTTPRIHFPIKPPSTQTLWSASLMQSCEGWCWEVSKHFQTLPVLEESDEWSFFVLFFFYDLCVKVSRLLRFFKQLFVCQHSVWQNKQWAFPPSSNLFLSLCAWKASQSSITTIWPPVKSLHKRTFYCPRF